MRHSSVTRTRFKVTVIRGYSIYRDSHILDRVKFRYCNRSILTWVIGFTIKDNIITPFILCSIAEVLIIFLFKPVVLNLHGLNEERKRLNILARLPVNLIDRFIVIFGGYFISFLICKYWLKDKVL